MGPRIQNVGEFVAPYANMRRARPDREDNHGTGRPHLLDKTNALVARGLQGSAADQHILTNCVS
jgi:hypothetical protein